MIDWDQINTDAMTAGATNRAFVEGDPADPTTLPFYTPAGGVGFTLAVAVFDQAFREVTLLDDTPSATSTPALGVLLSQFVSPPRQGDQVYIPRVDTTYIVKEKRPDSHGWALLLLMGPVAP